MYTAIPTPTITVVEQMTQSTVSVNMSVDSTVCAATYVVNAAQNGDSGSGSSPTLPVTIEGLDVCTYTYEIIGNVVTPGGSNGDMSSPFSFTANLSGEFPQYLFCSWFIFFAEVNGVSNVRANSERNVLQWDQIPNTNYPTCITSYSITWGAGVTYSTTDTTTSVTRDQLSAASFPFCMTTSVTVTPVTPMELLAGRESTGDISLIAPGI